MLRCHNCATEFPAPSEETWDAGACVPVYTCPECGAWGEYHLFDPEFPVFVRALGEDGEYVADDLNGVSHYGLTWWACLDAVEEANRAASEHAQKCGACFRDCRTAFSACELQRAAVEPVTQMQDSRDSAF